MRWKCPGAFSRSHFSVCGTLGCTSRTTGRPVLADSGGIRAAPINRGAAAAASHSGRPSSARRRTKGLRISGRQTASVSTISDNPMAPPNCASCRAGVPISAWPGKAQGKPVKITPRTTPARVSDMTVATAKPEPDPRTTRRASAPPMPQNSAMPPAVSASPKGAIQPWRARSTRNGSTIQLSASAKYPAPPAHHVSATSRARESCIAMKCTPARPRMVRGHRSTGACPSAAIAPSNAVRNIRRGREKPARRACQRDPTTAVRIIARRGSTALPPSPPPDAARHRGAGGHANA